MNPLTKFFALLFACIILMSFLLTGMFYLAHASEFPTTTITNSTTIATGGAPEPSHTGTPISTAPTAPVQTRTINDYGLVTLTLLVILASILVIFTYYKKKK